MVSSIKITKLIASKASVYADNMVSVKNNGASNGNKANNNKDNNIKSYVNGDVRLNKDGSIRKKPGPKTGKILINSMVKSNSQKKNCSKRNFEHCSKKKRKRSVK